MNLQRSSRCRWVFFVSAIAGLAGAPDLHAQPSYKQRPYVMCRLLSRKPAPPSDAQALALFDAAVKDDAARRHDAAAQGFMKAAALQMDFRVNRRISYANAVNTWLSAGLADRARAALSTAAQGDPELARELTAWAADLPHAAKCSEP